MTKLKTMLIIIFVILIAIFSGCSNQETISDSKTVANTTVVTSVESTTEEKMESETTTEKASGSEITTKPTEQKSAGQTTTKKVTTTQKSTTTERQTTTKKVTTTQKQTTTKKVTTTSAPYWCDEGGTHHIVDVGPIGWCSSYDEAQNKALRYIDNNADSGSFRVMQCYGCGLYTADVTLDK